MRDEPKESTNEKDLHRNEGPAIGFYHPFIRRNHQKPMTWMASTLFYLNRK